MYDAGRVTRLLISVEEVCFTQRPQREGEAQREASGAIVSALAILGTGGALKRITERRAWPLLRGRKSISQPSAPRLSPGVDFQRFQKKPFDSLLDVLPI